jgi:N-acetylmuramoyl-L-alanine amidase
VASPPKNSVKVETWPAGAAAAAVRSVAYTRLPKGDRITLELSREVTYTSARAANPDLLVLDLAGVAAADPIRNAAGSLRGTFVSGLRLEARADATQVTLQLDGAPRYSTFPLYDPYRLVIDIEGATASTAAPMLARGAPPSDPVPGPGRAPEPIARPEAPASTSRGDYSLARQLGLGVSRVVIDPGHGGHDPGAQANALSEAELVLDVSLRLAALLEAQPGFEVVLTRRTDTFVPLEERTAIANREGADLFLSIHANSSPNAETRGIETFFLNFAESASAEAVAARENASSAQAMHLLPDLVKTIATNDKVAESRELASMVHESLMKRIGSLSKTIKDLGVKQAPFVVLIGAEMPSVLAEISFLTNRTEAGLLRQAAHRQRVAQALCDAVLRYQASLKTPPTIATRSEER